MSCVKNPSKDLRKAIASLKVSIVTRTALFLSFRAHPSRVESRGFPQAAVNLFHSLGEMA